MLGDIVAVVRCPALSGCVSRQTVDCGVVALSRRLFAGGRVHAAVVAGIDARVPRGFAGYPQAVESDSSLLHINVAPFCERSKENAQVRHRHTFALRVSDERRHSARVALDVVVSVHQCA